MMTINNCCRYCTGQTIKFASRRRALPKWVIWSGKNGHWYHQCRAISMTGCRRNEKPAHDVGRYRVVGIMAHIDAGKTTTTERMLYYSGFQTTLGEVHHGDTTMDFLDLERERGITIQTAAVTFPWRDHTISLVDTPGHVDFTIEVERAIRVADGAVAVLDASAGVEAQTVTVWQQADRYGVPRLVYLNKMDKATASYELCLQQIRGKLQARPLLLQVPLGTGKSFHGVVDLISGRKLCWDHGNSKDRGASYSVSAQSVSEASDPELYSAYSEARTALIDALGDLDNSVAEHILQSESMETVPHDLLHRAVRRATLQQCCVPVLLGSSYRNTAVQPLMDAMLRYLPAPHDRLPAAAQLYRGSLCALAFKVTYDPQRGGLLTFVRVYSGAIDKNKPLYNVSQRCQERPARMYVALGGDLLPTDSVPAGSIVVLAGLKNTSTGDTLVSSKDDVRAARLRLRNTDTGNASASADRASAGADRASAGASASAGSASASAGAEDGDSDDEDSVEKNEHLLVGVKVPEPVFFCAIEAVSLSQQRALEEALGILQREDPSLTVRHDPDTMQTVLGGMGELHLEVVVEGLRTRHQVEVEVGRLQVAYREHPQASASRTITVDKTIGGVKQLVSLTLSVDPAPDDHPRRLLLRRTKENAENLDSLKRPQLAALRRGVDGALSYGPVLGYPVHSAAVHLLHCTASRSTASAVLASTAAQCLKQLLAEADCRLAEPIMLLTVAADADHADLLIADLKKRSADVRHVLVRNDTKHVEAHVPLAELLGYASALRRLTSGRASFSMSLLRYDVMSDQRQRLAVSRTHGVS